MRQLPWCGDNDRNTTKLPKVRGGVLAQLSVDIAAGAIYPARWRRGAEGTMRKWWALISGLAVGFLSLAVWWIWPDPGDARRASGVGQSAKTEKKEATQLGPASSLRGMVYCAKVGRLAFHWDNGDFQLCDTHEARRLGQ